MKFMPLLMVGVTALTGCYTNQPISNVPPTNNQTYNVAYLFEHEGCKVYRFNDLGQWVYFTNCNGETINITSDSTDVIRNRIKKN